MAHEPVPDAPAIVLLLHDVAENLDRLHAARNGRAPSQTCERDCRLEIWCFFEFFSGFAAPQNKEGMITSAIKAQYQLAVCKKIFRRPTLQNFMPAQSV